MPNRTGALFLSNADSMIPKPVIDSGGGSIQAAFFLPAIFLRLAPDGDVWEAFRRSQASYFSLN